MAGSGPAVLVLGGTGMLGHLLAARLRALPGWRVRHTQRRDPRSAGYLDALGPDAAIDAAIADQGGADYLVNAIGLTQSQIRTGGPAVASLAEALNAHFPQRLAAAAARAGARLIHLSTDGVFSGRAGPYSEASVPDPEDLYGRTKLAGEVVGPHALTLRCSIIGPDPQGGRGLYEWFRRLAPGEHVRGFVDQQWNGVTSEQLAALCRAVIEQGLFDRVTRVSSLRHFCPNRGVSKYELLRLFEAELGHRVVIEPAESGDRRNRLLVSRWEDLCLLAGGPLDMAEAVRAMVRAPLTI